MTIQTFLVDGVYIRIAPSLIRPAPWYLGLAKREPFVLRDADGIMEPGSLWFRFGADASDLVDDLVAEVKQGEA